MVSAMHMSYTLYISGDETSSVSRISHGLRISVPGYGSVGPGGRVMLSAGPGRTAARRLVVEASSAMMAWAVQECRGGSSQPGSARRGPVGKRDYERLRLVNTRLTDVDMSAGSVSSERPRYTSVACTVSAAGDTVKG
jgi:hypothetical protein